MRSLTFSLLTLLAVQVGSLCYADAAQAASTPGSRLDLQTRAAHHRAIETVYHGHRTWSDLNPGPRPALDELLPAETIEGKAADAVRKSHALERYWGRPITGARLQAEIDRMARASRQPGRLAELWSALGNDPYLIAEVLARPLLADRLLREWYASDDRFHGALEEQVRADTLGEPTAESLRSMTGDYTERELTAEAASGSRAIDSQAWEARLASVARRFGTSAESLQSGAVTGLLEDANRFYVLAVLEREADRLVLASVEWHKQPFETWWERVAAELPVEIAPEAYDYRLPSLGGECADDSWQPTLALPDPRYEHTAVWTGSEMIVWGGMASVGHYPRRGGRYDPATDSWTLVGQIGEPGRRAEHTAVWTGTEMVVWGGHGVSPSNTGGRYNPATDTWKSTSLAGAPQGRDQHVAVWAGRRMIVWGGGKNLSSGGLYDPMSDSWRATSLSNAPDGRDLATVVWTGEEMIIWGGFSDPFTLDTGGRYNPVTDTWQATSLANVPSFRHFHTAVWTGEEMIVWGGVGVGFGTSTGGRYDPATDSWQATSVAGAPTPRWLQEAIWTGGEMIIWGGTILLSPHPETGGRYDPVTNSWTPMSTANVPEGREDSASVWTGSEFLVWGGLGDESFVNSGGRYDPALNSWLPTQTYNVPTARGLHTAVWTGAEMMIYGGNLLEEPGGLYNPATDTWRPVTALNAPRGIQNMTSVWTGAVVIVWGGFPETDEGGRYDPITDTWFPTSTSGAPSRRYWHTAVWTGTEMIVWGGWPGTDTGGRYNPDTNTWMPTSTAGAPSPRDSHIGVWSGDEMIIWGGFPETAVERTGGRYDPATDSWTPTGTAGAPDRRSSASAVWTGTQMIVWGGQSFQDFDVYNTGGRYDPSTDSWQPTDVAGAPTARVTPAVWTGAEMIVWGGDLQSSTGGRYNPLGDSWQATTLTGAPTGRWNTTLVWTGEQMIAWGGILETATGGLYCARLEGNQIPIARSDDYATEMGTLLLVPPPGVLANDTDGDGDDLRAQVIDGPANGEFRFRSDGAFAYLPNAGFAGTDEFTYRAGDRQAPSDTVTVSIEVGCTENCLRVVNIVIDILLDSTRSRIWVETETSQPVSNALVTGTWTLPSGETITQSGMTDAFGQATLEIPDDSSGTFWIRIDDVEKSGFTFDPANSILSNAKTR